MADFRFNPYPALETVRLHLRKLTPDDTYDLMRIRSNKIVNEFIDRSPETSFEDATKFIENINQKIENNLTIYWGIALKENNILIGTICLWNLSVKHSAGELGYELHPDFHGKGIMQEAVQPVISYGFGQMQLRVITALPKKGNIRSIQLLIKNKFVQDEGYRFVKEEDAIGYWVYYLLKY